MLTLQLECLGEDTRYSISLPAVPRRNEQVIILGVTYRVNVVRYSIPDEPYSGGLKRDPIIYVEVSPI